MNEHRGPHHSGKCPFHIVPGHPLSAEASVDRCVACVTRYNTQLESLYEDFRQIAFLTILEEEPKYDSKHPSRASFTTFMKSRICSRLWSERRNQLKSLPFPHHEEYPSQGNLLIHHLIAETCACEREEDAIVREMEVEEFCQALPKLLTHLSEKECEVLRLKYFEESKGVEIAKQLSISEGRVSQLLKTALTKLQKAYLLAQF